MQPGRVANWHNQPVAIILVQSSRPEDLYELQHAARSWANRLLSLASSLADKRTEQAPQTSLPEHGSAEHPAASSLSTSNAASTTDSSRCTSTMTTSESSSTTAEAPATTAATTTVSATTTVPHHGRMQLFTPQQIIRNLPFKLSQRDQERKASPSTHSPETSSATCLLYTSPSPRD